MAILTDGVSDLVSGSVLVRLDRLGGVVAAPPRARFRPLPPLISRVTDKMSLHSSMVANDWPEGSSVRGQQKSN